MRVPAETTRRADRPLGARLAALALGAVAALLGAPLAAQVPPDSVRPDTTVIVPIPPAEVAGDTLPRDSLLQAVADSLRPAPNYPLYQPPVPEGYAFGRWEWTRDDLLRYRGLSLLDLLARAPGLFTVRAGGFGRPAGLTALGLGGARLRVFVDGFELDPLEGATLDLQQFGVIDLETVRVERTPGEVRVELATFRLDDARPYSEIEIGAGNYDTKLLRGILSRAFGSRSVLTGVYELATTDGYGLSEPFQFGGGRVSWSYLPRAGVALRLDASRSAIQREGRIYPLEADRGTLILRARTEPLPGLVVDGALGRIWWGASDSTRAVIPTEGAVLVDTVAPSWTSDQLTLRAGYRFGLGFLEGTGRLRAGDERGAPRPDRDLELRAVLRPLRWVVAEGSARGTTVDGQTGTETYLAARVGPFGGLSLFANAGAGERWLGTVRDTTETSRDAVVVDSTLVRFTREITRPVFGTVAAQTGGVRVGAEWAGWGARVGVAAVTLAETTVAPFSLAYDRGFEPVEVGAVSGVEARAEAPVPFTRGALRLDGWYARWSDLEFRPYLPREQGRLAAELHGVYYDGQLEPTLRVEAEHRGESYVPAAETGLNGGVTEPYSLLNLYLQIRIQDVRAFLFYENLLNNRTASDLALGSAPAGRADLLLPGPRILYGARWFFRN